ncbi:hypothetical protein PIIN_11658 [Serendipita indica DSM 11827]|uniref:Uncharacterized protein n=1 Tax=Serendipita indica (strain DSM 11827) TaxID=1109443 RepID=G4U287_SERID|nr:hypothetical protein PIIN_11658 [Serendipita indica DSM 11827]
MSATVQGSVADKGQLWPSSLVWILLIRQSIMRFKLFKSNKKSHAKQDDLPGSSSSSIREGPSRRGAKVADTANVFLDFMANIAEASDILSPLKGACRATKTVLDTVQDIGYKE